MTAPINERSPGNKCTGQAGELRHILTDEADVCNSLITQAIHRVELAIALYILGGVLGVLLGATLILLEGTL